VIEPMNGMSEIDRKDVAARIAALSGMGLRALARRLGTTVATLDRIVVSNAATPATYARILPRLEKLEGEFAAYKATRELRAETASAVLLALLDEHANEVEKRGDWP
jgi:hypothetical protein